MRSEISDVSISSSDAVTNQTIHLKFTINNSKNDLI